MKENRFLYLKYMTSVISIIYLYFNNLTLYREREQPHHSFTKATNTPMQFENSLGKLQYSSVTAPRKIIDMDVVPNSDPNQTPSVQQKDTKKTRQLLLEIERVFIYIYTYIYLYVCIYFLLLIQ
jgi:hypothetical protein